MYTLYRPTLGGNSTSSFIWRTLSTEVLEAPSISITSRLAPLAISTQDRQVPQGFAVGPFSQLSALGEDARRARLPAASGTREQVGVGDAPARQAGFQRRRYEFLSGELVETLRPPAGSRDLIRHGSKIAQGRGSVKTSSARSQALCEPRLPLTVASFRTWRGWAAATSAVPGFGRSKRKGSNGEIGI